MLRHRHHLALLVGLLAAHSGFACSKEVRGSSDSNDNMGGAPGDGDGDGSGDGDGDRSGDGDGDGSGDGDGDVGAAPGDGDGDQTGDGDGDGDGSGGSPQTEGLEVVDVTPGPDAADVARTSDALVIEFNKILDADTVDESTVYLTGPHGTVPATLQVDGAMLTLALENELLLLASYTLHVTPGVADVDGLSLESEYSSSFSTADGALTETQPVETDPADRIGNVTPKSGVAANGDVLVVYQLQEDITGDELAPHARWHRRATGWEDPVPLDPNQTSSCSSLDVSVNENGEAVAAWTCGTNVFIRIYRNGVWESTRQQLIPEVSGSADVEMLESGTVLGAYQQLDSNQLICFTARQANNFTVETVERSGAPGQYEEVEYGTVSLAASSTGDAMAVWAVKNSQTDVRSVAYLRHAASNGSWTQGTLLPGSGAPVGRYRPTISMTETGNAIAAWVEEPVTNEHDLRAAHFRPADGWGAPQTLDNQDSFVSNSVTAAPLGQDEFLVAYVQAPASVGNAYVTTYADGEWSSPVLMSDGATQVLNPGVASDGRGNAFYAWGYVPADFENPQFLQVRRLSSLDGGWTDITPDPTDRIYSMRLSVSPSGFGALTWIGLTGEGFIVSPTRRVDVSLKLFQ